jgi:hypothetical protein
MRRLFRAGLGIGECAVNEGFDFTVSFSVAFSGIFLFSLILFLVGIIIDDMIFLGGRESGLCL